MPDKSDTWSCTEMPEDISIWRLWHTKVIIYMLLEWLTYRCILLSNSWLYWEKLSQWHQWPHNHRSRNQSLLFVLWLFERLLSLLAYKSEFCTCSHKILVSDWLKQVELVHAVRLYFSLLFHIEIAEELQLPILLLYDVTTFVNVVNVSH